MRPVNILFRAAVLFVLLAGPSGTASAADRNSIYVIDMQRVLSDSIIGKAARSNVENELKKREAGLEKTRKEVLQLKADLDKQSAVLSKEAAQTREDQLRVKEREFQRQVADQREEVMKKQEAEVARAIKEINEIIATISKREGYGIVLNKDPRVVLAVDSRLEITDSVIKALNEKKIGS